MNPADSFDGLRVVAHRAAELSQSIERLRGSLSAQAAVERDEARLAAMAGSDEAIRRAAVLLDVAAMGIFFTLAKPPQPTESE